MTESGHGRPNRWQVILLLGVSCVCGLGQPRSAVLVVATSTAGPYGTALEGLRGGLLRGGQTMTVIDLSQATAGSPAQWIRAHHPDLIVAIGSKATQAVASAGGNIPLISTMVLGSGGQSRGTVAVLGLEPAPERWIARMSALFPRLRRLGLLGGKATPVSTLDAVELCARQRGYTVRRAQCADVSEALAAISAMAGRVDLIWFAADSTLLNDATVKPLLLAALQRQVPVIGFSEAFVRSGAAAGFFADYADIGLRAAEMAQRVLSGGSVAGYEPPRLLKVAVNERVVRILGLRRQMADPQVAEALVIR